MARCPRPSPIRAAALLVAILCLAGQAQAQTSPTTPAAPAATAAVDDCKRGAQLEELGRPAEAASAYLKGLASKTASDCSERLKALQRSKALCAEARALEDLERDSEANAAYRKILSAVPDSSCARRGVGRTDDETAWGWLGGAIKNFGNVIVAGTLLLLVAALLFLLLTWLAARMPWIRAMPGIRALRRPVVNVTALDDSALSTEKLGASTTALLRARVARSGQADGRIDLAAGEAGSSEALAGLGDVSGQAKALVALVDMIASTIRTSQWKAAGELHPATNDGRGLTLSLRRGGSYDDFGDFWTTTDGGPQTDSESEAYRRLTIPAAGWVRHRVAGAEDPDRLLTGDPRSYAQFEAGLYWQEQGDAGAARMFYERALAFDPRNVGALANLGVMEMEAGNTAAADSLLTRALDALEA